MLSEKSDKDQSSPRVSSARSLVQFANNTLNERDALAVTIIANSGPVSGTVVGAACGRGHSWLSTRLEGINKQLAIIAVEIGLQDNRKGYVVKLKQAPVEEPEPIVQPTIAPQTTEAKPRFFRNGPYLVRLDKVCNVSADTWKKRVNIGLIEGGMYIPAEDSEALANAIIDACGSEGNFRSGSSMVRTSNVVNVTIDSRKDRVNIGLSEGGGTYFATKDPETVATALIDAVAASGNVTDY